MSLPTRSSSSSSSKSKSDDDDFDPKLNIGVLISKHATAMLTLVPTLQGQENFYQWHNCLMTCKSNFSIDNIFFDLGDAPYDFDKEEGKLAFQRQVLWSVRGACFGV